MADFFSLNSTPKGSLKTNIKTLVIFGEYYALGYIGGLIKEAKSRLIDIIYSTTGRRLPEGGELRPLTDEELQTVCPTGAIINVPLEAGFDMEPASPSRIRPVQLLDTLHKDSWETHRLNKELIEEACRNATISFRKRTAKWLKEVEQKILESSGDVLIAHTMAGGVPRAKNLLPVLNRVVKGREGRFLSSEAFCHSDLGWFCLKNFLEVTGNTFSHLLDLSTPLREKLKKQGRDIFYIAYSYHGTQILIGDSYQWQTYAPYLQGTAKLRLENISREFYSKGVKSCVFNVPEILTRSTGTFGGLELPLYSLLKALKRENGNSIEHPFFNQILDLLAPDALDRIHKITETYFHSKAVEELKAFPKWPQHNSPEQMKSMLEGARELLHLHKDRQKSISPLLSNLILNITGQMILREINNPECPPVSWIGHDIIAKLFINRPSTG